MSDDAIQRFDCVSGVDNLADRLRVHKDGGNIRPVCPPAATYLRVPCIPFLPERIQRLQRAFFRGCAVNLFQITGYRFIVLPRHESHAVAYHMYYAQLELRLRGDGINRFREAFQAVHAGDKDIVQAAIFQFRQYIQPELCTFIFGQPHTQQLFLTIKVNTQSQEHRFVDNPAVLPYFQDNTVKINNGINRIQRTVLLFNNLVDYGIGYFRYQRRRDVCIVHFFED